jgi:hypothetical protein
VPTIVRVSAWLEATLSRQRGPANVDLNFSVIRQRNLKPAGLLTFLRGFAQKFYTDLTSSLPDHAALSPRVALSLQMQREPFRQIIDITDIQTRAYFTQVDELAPFKDSARRLLEPSGLVYDPPEKTASVKKMRVHCGSDWR